jgi:ABC-type spermidine/putrescine transport system permease subunit II
MLFDKLIGQDIKDWIIIILIVILIPLLSWKIISLNGKVTWWTSACDTYEPGKEKHRYENDTDDFAIKLAWISIIICVLILFIFVFYSIFTKHTTGEYKILGRNSMGGINSGRFSF